MLDGWDLTSMICWLIACHNCSFAWKSTAFTRVEHWSRWPSTRKRQGCHLILRKQRFDPRSLKLYERLWILLSSLKFQFQGVNNTKFQIRDFHTIHKDKRALADHTTSAGPPTRWPGWVFWGELWQRSLTRTKALPKPYYWRPTRRFEVSFFTVWILCGDHVYWVIQKLRAEARALQRHQLLEDSLWAYGR